MTYDDWLAEAQATLALAKLRGMHTVPKVKATWLAALWSGQSPHILPARWSYESWCKYVGREPLA